MIVLNSLRDKGAGFGTDTNKVTVISADGAATPLPLMPKADVARAIIDEIIKHNNPLCCDTINVTHPLLAVGLPLGAQELNCNVEINTSQVQNVNKQVFETLQSAINDYMNTTKFTGAQFNANEKIECKLFFTIKEQNDTKITGDLQVQSTRPVYNSTYSSTILNFKDTKIEFEYQENEPLVFNENNMESNLTAILNYYAYLIIALDFDTFGPRGGDPYWERVDQVVRMAQSSGESGWKQFEDTKNRAAVLSAFTDPATSTLRDMLYNYHRKGLDEMSVSPDKAAPRLPRVSTRSRPSMTSPRCRSGSHFSRMPNLTNLSTSTPREPRTSATASTSCSMASIPPSRHVST